MNMPIKLHQFSANDVIYLAGRTIVGTGVISGTNQETFLYIKKV